MDRRIAFAAALLAVVIGATDTYGVVLSDPAYAVDNLLNLEGEWIWDLGAVNPNVFNTTFTSDSGFWSITLDLFFNEDNGVVTATLRHLGIPHPDLGEGTDEGSGIVSTAEEVELAVPFTVDANGAVSTEQAGGAGLHGNEHSDAYALFFDPINDSQVRITITGSHPPGDANPVPAPSAALLALVGLGISYRKRRRAP